MAEDKDKNKFDVGKLLADDPLDPSDDFFPTSPRPPPPRMLNPNSMYGKTGRPFPGKPTPKDAIEAYQKMQKVTAQRELRTDYRGELINIAVRLLEHNSDYTVEIAFNAANEAIQIADKRSLERFPEIPEEKDVPVGTNILGFAVASVSTDDFTGDEIPGSKR